MTRGDLRVLRADPTATVMIAGVPISREQIAEGVFDISVEWSTNRKQAESRGVNQGRNQGRTSDQGYGLFPDERTLRGTQ